MQYVVCYDLSDDRRRERLASLLLNYGKRVQESVFVANLDTQLAARMTADVKKVIDTELDRVHIFELCAGCTRRTVILGTAEIVEDRAWYVV